MSFNRSASTEHLASQPISSDQQAPASGIDELVARNAALEEALDERTRENIFLNEMISTVGSTLKVDEVLSNLVDTLARAVSCHAAFIYLYEKERERLVLASSSEHYQHLVGKIELALGEGINGWVAMTLQPVLLKDNAMSDPRFRYYSELEDDKFQSVMTIPIIAKDRHLIGVITLHTVAPHEFTEHDQSFVSNTAALVAGAIENAQLYENTQKKLNVLTTLSVLSQTISSGLYLDEMLRSLATLTVQIMEADQCVILLMDQARGRLTVRASAPALNERALSFQSVDIDRATWEKLRDSNGRGSSLDSSGNTLERLNPLKDAHHKTLHSVPLVAGTDNLGMLNLYSARTRRYTSEDTTLLGTIANQIALAIKNSQLVDMLAQKNLVKGFFDDLMYGTYDSEEALRQRGNFIGCDLSKTHTIAMIEIMHLGEENGEEKERAPALPARAPSQADAPSLQTEEERLALHKRITGQVRRRISDSYPGSVLNERENVLTCIVCLSKDPTGSRLKTSLRDLARQLRIEHGVRMSAGIGNQCQHIPDFRRGFAEAAEALQMGQSLNSDGGVTHFNDLGVYRYLYKIARMDDLRDMYQDQVARIATYDRRKGTDLLDTLETYLECAGNLTKTSNRLFVHRNTLIQRLERLQSLCEIDLQERSNWLTLQVAIKIYKLRSNK